MIAYINDIQSWIKKEGINYFQELGIKKDQVIVDFGCNTGHYALPAARVVGPEGKVYAIDLEQTAIDELMKTAEREQRKEKIFTKQLIPS